MRLRFALALAPSLVACGSSAPSDAEIYYAAALRPGVELTTSPAERSLLTRIAELPEGAIALEGERFELGPSYAAASGRVCRRVRTAARERLACASHPADGPDWTFVPDPFGASGESAPVPPATYDGTASATGDHAALNVPEATSGGEAP